jgi:hypothetical protein
MDRRGACHGEDAARQMPIWGGVFVAKVPVDQQVAVDRSKTSFPIWSRFKDRNRPPRCAHNRGIYFIRERSAIVFPATMNTPFPL